MAGFFTFILIIQALVAVTLITLILMQRSEGGGLAGGGSPAGMMSARGASDFLTRGTAILATAFVSLSIVLAALAANTRAAPAVDPSLLAPPTGAPTPVQAPPAQPPGQPVGLGPQPKAAAPAAAPAPAASNQTGAPVAQ